jgi:hypothetical protein
VPETEQERLDRQLDQLLQELRVAMPGVQVLFAFLLAVPFQQRFADVTEFQRTVYFVTLLASAAASALFIAPVAYHRLLFERGEKRGLIRRASVLAIAGLTALGVAMSSAIVLVTDLLFERATVIVTAVAVGLLFLWLWFGMALMRRARLASSRRSGP